MHVHLFVLNAIVNELANIVAHAQLFLVLVKRMLAPPFELRAVSAERNEQFIHNDNDDNNDNDTGIVYRKSTFLVL